jgi:CRP/FNR family cyclic AMP-dependent transcriptional regulator
MSLLAGVAAFREMPQAVLDRLERGGTPLELRDGARVFAQGDAADAVYAIVGGDGIVRIGAMDRRSKTLMVEVFRTGDIFGEVAVIDGGARTAEAIAVGGVRLLRIRATTFIAVLGDAPELGSNLCRMLAQRLRRTFDLFQHATFDSLEVRLARQLLYLAGRFARRTDRGLQLTGRYTQADLADLLGTTPRSIITILNSWRAKNLVVYDAARGQLTLIDEAALQALMVAEAHE